MYGMWLTLGMKESINTWYSLYQALETASRCAKVPDKESGHQFLNRPLNHPAVSNYSPIPTIYCG